ncbi:transposase [Acidimicrobium ferrooxidans]|uniref:transposase n=1 Tax=Acidimicrobium ferrooxidans TaxID=53635 RepID=UPI000A01E5C2
MLVTKGGTWSSAIRTAPCGELVPAIGERRRRVDRALSRAWFWRPTSRGLSTRSVDDLIAACGRTEIAKGEVSRIVASLDEEMARFHHHRLGHRSSSAPPSPMPPGVMGRLEHQVISSIRVAITGIHSAGVCEVFGSAVSAMGRARVCGASARGSPAIVCLGGVHLCNSDGRGRAHQAIASSFVGRTRERCCVQHARRARSHRRRGATEMVLAQDPHDLCSKPPRQHSRPSTTRSSTRLPTRLPAARAMVAEATEEVCTASRELLAHDLVTNPLWSGPS